MPTALLTAYMTALPQVMADENMRSSTVVAMGSGTMEKQARRKVMGEWTRAARGDVHAEKLPLELRKTRAAMIGIKIG